MHTSLKSFEICAGAGGSALGLERAGFEHVLLAEVDELACETLRLNRPGWSIWQGDVRTFTAFENPVVYDVDLLSGGLPAAAYSRAGKPGVGAQGDLIECMLDIASEVRPRSVMIENVPDLLKSASYASVRKLVRDDLGRLGYEVFWDVLDAADFGVPQHRRRSYLIALDHVAAPYFGWPAQAPTPAPSIGETLYASMTARGWEQARSWADHATGIAPTIVGGSKQRGGADLGPSRSKRAWARQWVDGGTIGDQVPAADWTMTVNPDDNISKGYPTLTVEQVAILQGFPPEWQIAGKKTARYRQVAQASPPPLIEALGRSIVAALEGHGQPDGRRSSRFDEGQPTLF